MHAEANRHADLDDFSIVYYYLDSLRISFFFSTFSTSARQSGKLNKTKKEREKVENSIVTVRQSAKHGGRESAGGKLEGH